MIYGIIDIGAGSIRLSLYEVQNGGIRLVLSKKSAAGLAGYAEDGSLSQKGIHKACSVLESFNTVLAHVKADRVDMFAAAYLSGLANTEDVAGRLGEAAGRSIRLLSGEEEAKLAFLGASRTVPLESGLFADIGGGSAELAGVENGRAARALSIPYGALTLSLKYVRGVTPHKSNILAMKQELRRELKRTKLFEDEAQAELCVSGGTARAVRKIYNDLYELPEDNFILEFDRFSGILTKYIEERRDVMRRIKQLIPDRLHTVIPGLVILHTIATLGQSRRITVATTGVREGYLMRHVLGWD